MPWGTYDPLWLISIFWTLLPEGTPDCPLFHCFNRGIIPSKYVSLVRLLTSSNKISDAALEDKLDSVPSWLSDCDGCFRIDFPFVLDFSFFSLTLFPFLPFTPFFSSLFEAFPTFWNKAPRGPDAQGRFASGLLNRPANDDSGTGPLMVVVGLLLITRCDWVASSSCERMCFPERLEALLTSNTFKQENKTCCLVSYSWNGINQS